MATEGQLFVDVGFGNTKAFYLSPSEESSKWRGVLGKMPNGVTRSSSQASFEDAFRESKSSGTDEYFVVMDDLYFIIRSEEQGGVVLYDRQKYVDSHYMRVRIAGALSQFATEGKVGIHWMYPKAFSDIAQQTMPQHIVRRNEENKPIPITFKVPLLEKGAVKYQSYSYTVTRTSNMLEQIGGLFNYINSTDDVFSVGDQLMIIDAGKRETSFTPVSWDGRKWQPILGEIRSVNVGLQGVIANVTNELSRHKIYIENELAICEAIRNWSPSAMIQDGTKPISNERFAQIIDIACSGIFENFDPYWEMKKNGTRSVVFSGGGSEVLSVPFSRRYFTKNPISVSSPYGMEFNNVLGFGFVTGRAIQSKWSVDIAQKVVKNGA